MSIVWAASVFGSIGMLAWAAAAIVPLVLHLWNRRQHQRAPWAAMEFLLAAVQDQARRMRLEQLLLLLLRMAIPIVLALALADPIWETLGNSLRAAVGSQAPTHHLFVIDTSYSMEYAVAGRTRLEQAKQAAIDVIEQASQGDGFTLVNLSDPSETIVGLPAFSSADAKSEIANLQIRDNVADLRSALTMVRETIESVRIEFPRLQQHRVYFLSDMGRTTWDDAKSPSVREQVGWLENLADIVTVDVGAATNQNAAITSLQRITRVVTPERNVAWQATVEGLVGDDFGETTIEWLVDGRLADKETIKIELNTPTTCGFEYRFDSVGQHRIEARIVADNLQTDDHRYEVVFVRDRIKVLCVEGTPNSARNLALALAPSDESVVHVRVLPEHRLSETMLGEYETVFLCNIARFTAETVTQLRSYLKNNGSLVTFLGDQVDAENYNQMLNTAESPLLQAQLLEVAPYASYRFAPEGYRHPIVAAFRGQERSGFLTTPIWNYVRMRIADGNDEPASQLKPSAQSPAKVVLRFTNGDPTIIESTLPVGRHITFAVPASELSVSRQDGQLRPWTAWNAWPSFPPIIQETLAHTLAGKDNERNLTVGEPILGRLPLSHGHQRLVVTQPNQMSRRIEIQENDGTPTWMLDQTNRSGFYTVSLGGEKVDEYVAVNLPPSREGYLERVIQQELPSQFQQNAIRTTNQNLANVGASRTSLFRWMLGLLLCLLFAESYFAWYLGNAR